MKERQLKRKPQLEENGTLLTFTAGWDPNYWPVNRLYL